ncbi:MAG: hypothetical protein IT366_13595 [Candidatus Hydrogenedentes bacterium]|nr:hypothetical protein [Candidatus Hydrogenedentota bacterium]
MVAGNPGERTIRLLSYGILVVMLLLAIGGSVFVRSLIPLILLVCLLAAGVFSAGLVMFPLIAVVRGAGKKTPRNLPHG